MPKPDITAVTAACIKDGVIFMVRNNKDFWLLPGGKMESCDNGCEIHCLEREIREELPKAHLNILRRLDSFYGRTRTGGKITLVVYLADITGELTPAAEIQSAQWVREPEALKLLGATRRAVQYMREQGLL